MVRYQQSSNMKIYQPIFDKWIFPSLSFGAGPLSFCHIHSAIELTCILESFIPEDVICISSIIHR